jgi:gliding motility-associated lipoprotein GldH
MKEIFLLISILTLLISCDSDFVYEKNLKIPGYEWDINAPLIFLVPVSDTVSRYTMYINVRQAAGTYRFSNLYLFLTTTFPQGRIERDTLECILATPEGKWLGDGMGNVLDNRFLFKKNFRFQQAGEYRFEMMQAMRVNPLIGVTDAGIRIEKSK